MIFVKYQLRSVSLKAMQFINHYPSTIIKNNEAIKSFYFKGSPGLTLVTILIITTNHNLFSKFYFFNINH